MGGRESYFEKSDCHIGKNAAGCGDGPVWRRSGVFAGTGVAAQAFAFFGGTGVLPDYSDRFAAADKPNAPI